MIALNNEQPIDGYYYYLIGAAAACSEKSADIQTADKAVIETMIQSPLSL